MDLQKQIEAYIAAQPEPKRSDMQQLHQVILSLMPGSKLWYLDGKDEKGKTVSNPNIGYGSQTVHYADGKTREFYQIGMSANTTGISIYVMGLNDKKYLHRTFGTRIGKASVTGYCIKFKRLADIDVDVLKEAMRCGGAGKHSTLIRVAWQRLWNEAESPSQHLCVDSHSERGLKP